MSHKTDYENGSWTPLCSAEEQTLKELRRRREQAKFRPRRIIMNNDGNDFSLRSGKDLENPRAFLDQLTTGLLDSQVDAVFYCTGVFNRYSHPMDECEYLPDTRMNPKLIEPMKQRGMDSLKIMTEFCRRHNKEIFWSFRFNDTHDAGKKSRDLFSQWKKDHPECLVATEKDRPNLSFGNKRWSSLDYGRPEVRDKAYRILAEICRRYEVDGFEIDFFRHPVLFRQQVWGEPVTQKHCDQFTDLMRRLRRMTEQEGLRRGRPILIAVRIPDSVGYCMALGIDLCSWLEEGLVDIVTGGGYFKLEPWENLVALGQKYNVPVYACLVRRRIEKDDEPEGATALKIWRGEAYQAWKAGVSGIYTFNRFNPRDPIFRQIGDPKMLENLERIDQTAYVNEALWSRPEVWVKSGRSYLKIDK